ncbi:integrase core domain protein [Janthinobacterium sp. HH103]|nr:integrase core domain protein [Janthinobacterium sp. HH100]OEZ70687.1 integrase core domain protein [Janthinobacterium sp. HH103]QOU70895.1 IS3 family transposase ISKpn18 [Janthinobacterium sp. HH102]
MQFDAQSGLKPVWRCKFIHTTDSEHDLPIAPNVLNRQFDPPAPNMTYVTDITYIRTGAGWVYLAIVLDLFAHKVVAWPMAPSMPAELVCNALHGHPRQPCLGLVVHSDRSSQYASALYQELLDEHGFVCSMSRKGNCCDTQSIMVGSAIAERFFLNLKTARVW